MKSLRVRRVIRLRLPPTSAEVGGVGKMGGACEIAPPTTSMSRKCSTTELRACGAGQDTRGGKPRQANPWLPRHLRMQPRCGDRFRRPLACSPAARQQGLELVE